MMKDTPARLARALYILAWHCAFGLSIELGIFSSRHNEVSHESGDTQRAQQRIRKEGRYYAPGLYPQVPKVFNFTHNTTWYATSAYIDMRPQIYNEPPSVVIIAAGRAKGLKLAETGMLACSNLKRVLSSWTWIVEERDMIRIIHTQANTRTRLLFAI